MIYWQHFISLRLQLVQAIAAKDDVTEDNVEKLVEMIKPVALTEQCQCKCVINY